VSACFGDTRRVFERKIRLPVVNFFFFFVLTSQRERERDGTREKREREREREREAPTGLHKKKESSLFPQHLSLFATNTNALSLSLSLSLCTHSRCGWKSNQNRYRINEYRHSSCIRNRFESFARIRRRS